MFQFDIHDYYGMP